ncbi:MAG: mechanosensitive ion channel family protein, partial [Pseudomonadales bacterium]
TIGVRYDDGEKVAEIVADVKAMLQSHPDITTDRTLIVNFNSFGASSLDFFIYCFTHTTDWVEYHGVKQDVLLKIQDIILGHGAEVAFPTTTVHLHEAALPNPEPEADQ